MSSYIFFAPNGDGWLNLARDGYLLQHIERDDIIIYFYVNTDSVIIGRNQNAWRECNLNAMERDNVRLVRRHTGGGAVFHDTGNLNFSFIMNEKKYDLDRQLGVILSAAAKLGINAERSGRNDLTVNGRKFSGNAFGLAKGNRSHHGTILIDSDLTRLPQYLNVSRAKLESKGITSVSSRVCNLGDFADGLTTDEMRRIITDCFIKEYGPVDELKFSDAALSEIERGYAVQSSWEWRLGKSPNFAVTVEERFTFGEMQIHLDIVDGYIKDAVVYTDALDVSLPETAASCLRGCRLEPAELERRLLSMPDAAAGREISARIEEELF